MRTGGCSMQYDRRCQRCGKVMRTNVGTAVRMGGFLTSAYYVRIQSINQNVRDDYYSRGVGHVICR